MIRFLEGFGRFWWDFIVGDEWRIAAGVAIVLAVGGLAVAGEWMAGSTIVVIVAVAIAIVAILSIVLPARRIAAARRAADGT